MTAGTFLQAESEGAQLEIGKGSDCWIRIHGPYAAVARARSALLSLLFLDAKSVEVVEVPTELIDLVIGKGGENVKRVEAEHGVLIDSWRAPLHADASRMKFRGSVEGGHFYIGRRALLHMA
jgi:hypothetical protein